MNAEDLAGNFAETAERGTTSELAAADRTWTYGHIVVDEAQELSPMQWRLLFRRNPLKSFTIVGDVAQASAAAGTTSWDDAMRPFVGDQFRVEELTVNYRTPAQIAEVAEAMAEAHGVRITRSRAVRTSEWPVDVVRGQDAATLVTATIQADRAAAGADRDSTGTLAVIVPEALLAEVEPTLADAFGAEFGRGPRGLTRPIALLTAQEAKGLEFDVVVVVEPQRIVDEVTRGASALYVAMTRPTQRLHLVATGPLPAGLDALS